MKASSLPFRADPLGALLAVRVTPRAGRDAIAGVVAEPGGKATLKVRLAAPPVDGAANLALIVFLAKALDLPRSRLSTRSGDTGRQKLVHIAGDTETLLAALAALIATSATIS